MTIRDLLHLVIGNLVRVRGRVMMTALGVVVGTASFVALISLGAGLQRQALATLGSGATEIRVTGGVAQQALGASGGAAASGGASTPQALDSAMLERIANLPGVVRVTPFERVLAPLDVATAQLCSHGIQVLGVDAEALELMGLRAVAGGLMPGAGEAVLGARVPEALARSLPRESADRVRGASADLVGQTLWLYLSRRGDDGAYSERVARTKVVGILSSHSSALDFAILIPQRDASALNTWSMGRRRDPALQGYPEALVKVADVEQTGAVEARLVGLGLHVSSAREQAENLSAYFGELQALLGGIAAVSLLVAAFSIANTMLMAIAERTREIGLMKAVGASNRDVLGIFLGEAGSIGLLGGAVGVLIGMAISGAVNALGANAGVVEPMFGLGAGLRAFVPGWLPFLAIVSATLVGAASGLVPAARAARLVPMVALKEG